MSNSSEPPPQPSRQHLARGLNLPLGLVVVVFLGLMVALVAHAIWHISDLEARMHGIVDIQNRKIQLATDLQEATYNRYSALVHQTLAEDPFERDDSFQLYIKWGFHVGKARNELKAMDLDAFEKSNLEQQDALVAQVIVLQEEIADLAAHGEMAEAHVILATQLRPLNLQFTETVEQLRHHMRDGVRDALLATKAASSRAIHTHLALGGILLLLAGAIALATRRLLTRHADIIHRQMSDLEEVGIRLEHEASHDPLTGLANRALFQRRMREGLEHAQQENFQMGVMYLDLDDFKQVNDLHGHHVGDALLKEVAQRLRHVVRVSDTVARLGGDEFAIILTGLEDPSQCTTLRLKVEEEIGQPMVLEGLLLTPACSVGGVLYPRDGQTMKQLLKVADQRMYEIKRARKAEHSNRQR